MAKVQPNPYAEGRWYSFFVESDGSAYTLGPSDLEATISGTYLVMPADFHVIDIVYDIASTAATAASHSIERRFLADGKQGVGLPPKANMTSAHVYVFGHFK